MKLPILCVAVLCAFWLAACSAEAPAPLNIGDVAPAFQTVRADGAPVDFPADYRGQAVVLRFWADWCRYCAPEMRLIDAVWRRHQGKGLRVLAVNAGQDRATVIAFMNKLAVGYPALLDEQASIAKRYGVVGLPTTYFIDRQGVVRGKIVGEADEASFERQVLALLP